MVIGNTGYFMCALPYQLSLKEGLLVKKDLEAEMLEPDFDEVKWYIGFLCTVNLFNLLSEGVWFTLRNYRKW